MTPAEAATEVGDYAVLLEEEREAADPTDVGLAERSWLTWTPFHRFASGDCVAVDRSGEVVLWQHDLLDGGPYVHGLRLGATLTGFVSAWARVGFAEPRDWRQVTTAEDAGLNLDGAAWTLLL